VQNKGYIKLTLIIHCSTNKYFGTSNEKASCMIRYTSVLWFGEQAFFGKKTWARLHKTDFWTNNSTLLVEFLFHWIVGNHRKEFPPSRKPWRGAGTLVDGRSPAPS